MKSKLKSLLMGALLLGLLALLILYLYNNREAILQLLTLSPGLVAGMLALALGSCFINAVYHKSILDTYGLSLDFIDWAGITFVSNTLSFVLPLRADLVFTAAYYKRVKNFEIVKSISVAAGNIIFGVVFSLIQLVIGLVGAGLSRGLWPLPLWIATGGLCAGVCLFLFLCLRFGDRLPPFLQKIPKLQTAVTGFNDLLRNRKLLRKLLLCLFGTNLLHLLLFLLCFRAMGMSAPVDQAMLYNALARLCTLVAIVPGNIGIREAIMGASSQMLGDVFVSGVVVSLLQTAAFMLVWLIGGAAFALPVLRRMKKHPGKENSDGKESSI